MHEYVSVHFDHPLIFHRRHSYCGIRRLRKKYSPLIDELWTLSAHVQTYENECTLHKVAIFLCLHFSLQLAVLFLLSSFPSTSSSSYFFPPNFLTIGVSPSLSIFAPQHSLVHCHDIFHYPVRKKKKKRKRKWRNETVLPVHTL